ncbi:MAG: membrane protein insertase YidC [Acidobacteriota bacterium]
MSDNKQNTQLRFFLAVTLSMAFFFGWQYFFAPKKPVTDDANTAQTVATATPAGETQPAQPQQVQPQQTIAETPDATPSKEITVKTPRYQVKFDSKGAVATSWILLKNVSERNPDGKPLYADGSNKENEKPLELIPQEALNHNPRLLPFRLSTGDANLDAYLNQQNYQVSVNQDNLDIAEGQTQKIDFVLRDEANGIEVTKSFNFSADSYLTDLQIKLTKNGQVVPNTKLLIGASLGDQGIAHHNYYHIEPEAVVFVGGAAERHQGSSFVFDDKNEATLSVKGDIDWAGTGDAYFAMAAIPSQKVNEVDLQAVKYDVQTAPYFDGIISWVTRNEKTTETRHLITAYLPIAADGSTVEVYTGTKDYFALSDYNKILSNAVGRTIDIDDLVNFSNWSWVRPITKRIAIPIVYALNFLNNYTHNYGIAIIIFTLFFYSLLFPMRWYQSKSFKKSSANAPKMKELQERLKEMQKKGVSSDDPRMRELQMEQLKMTKDALPIGGCLPMLLQFPLLIALYTAVTVSIGFRQATFLWLPDLSAGDPYHFLEFVFAGSMILSMKFTPQAVTVSSEQQMQQKMMTYFMPVMMLWIMWGAPAGLLLYWLCGNIVSFLQQIIINRVNKPTDPPTTEVVSNVPKNAKNVKPKLSTS